MSSSNASVKAEGVLALLGAYKPDEDDTITVLHPSKTFENAGLELVRGDRSWHDKGVTDTPVTLTFSFWEKAPGNMSSMGISGFSSFNAEQREQAKLSLQSWSDVANITFSETSNTAAANIKFGLFDNSSRGSYAFAYNPDTSPSVAGQTGITPRTIPSSTIRSMRTSTVARPSPMKSAMRWGCNTRATITPRRASVSPTARTRPISRTAVPTA